EVRCGGDRELYLVASAGIVARRDPRRDGDVALERGPARLLGVEVDTTEIERSEDVDREARLAAGPDLELRCLAEQIDGRLAYLERHADGVEGDRRLMVEGERIEARRRADRGGDIERI